MSTEKVTLGNALMTIHENAFLEGYTSGYRRYRRYDFTKPLTDAVIKGLLKREYRGRSEMWRAGFILGWLTAMHALPRVRHFCKTIRHRQQQQSAETKEVSHV